MIDIETIGNDPSTVIVSFGAVCFNRDGIISKGQWELNLQEQINTGRTLSEPTLQWWMRQKDEARSVFNSKNPKLKPSEFIEAFYSFLDDALEKVGEGRDELKPWGNGSSFDISVTEDFIRQYHPEGREGVPWKFWNQWCFRTFNHLTKCKELVQRQGVHHDALDDAVFQTECVLAYWKKIDAKKARKKL